MLVHSFRVEALVLALLCVCLAVTSCSRSTPAKEDEFIRLMNTGRNYLDQNQADKAIPLFTQAVALAPSRTDAHLNLANAFLAAGQAESALRHARVVLDYDRNSAAAYYVAGCAHLRLGQFEEAVQMFQPSRDLDPTIAAVSYQLGRAHQELQQFEDAAVAYQEAISIEPDHPVAHYALSQALIRAGQPDAAQAAIEKHKAILAKNTGAPASPEVYERCAHTQARAPDKVIKPEPQGIPVTFADATVAAFGADSAKYQGPLAVLDYNHDDRNSLIAAEGTNGFRLLANTQGVFRPLDGLLPADPAGRFRQMVVGDLNNDRFEDVVLLGEKASHAYRFATNGAAREVTAASGLKGLVGCAGALVDLDFTGKLDLLVALPGGNGLRVLRNLGNMYFKDITATSGVPATVTGARQVLVDDWNNDDMMDVFVALDTPPPLYLQKQRGGPLAPTNLPPVQIGGAVLALGDLNGDSRADLIAAAPDHLDLLLGGLGKAVRLPLDLPGVNALRLVDYDNDGWLDVVAAGEGLRILRNVGDGQFTDQTAALGLDRLVRGRIEALAAADFDQDGDTDLALSVEGQGLKLLRNDGGNANIQLKLRLIGNRSNASGLGIRLEVTAGPFRVHRTVSALPVEIGVGKNTQLDSLVARWFDLAFNQIDVKPDPRAALPVFEPVLPTGSCPYLYAWDGRQFRFISDILGSAPMGLRVTETVFVDADPHEYVWLGGTDRFQPLDGQYTVQITEELREVLYLDEAKLVVVDHPPGTEVQTTDAMRPSKPFPRGELWTLENRQPLLEAKRLDGSDATSALIDNDGVMVSPERIRIPQLRGLAEPHGVVLDFGPLSVEKPLVLALTGWLRFGGGMANVAASHDPDLPFPFPHLEVETAAGQWQPVNVAPAVPSGKTKTILIDLNGKLPPRARRLRLATAYELHWDRIALFERRLAGDTRITPITPTRADLHWRGFSEFADLPWTQPLTPVYDRTFQNPHWAITPEGWCTRYGPVDPLVADEDNALVLLNGGDELTLQFDAAALPEPSPGTVRDFFIYTVGWDKDSDFHVELGWKVEPLPWHGMDDQAYGRQPRPPFPSDDLMRRMTTRWVPQATLKRAAR
ncbi:MAG TPA: FG-GAP-like repeat-containing protein [Candidatus Paceibacterota bacterium]|nr:FG-GAP-like repeat-containing protein [Candidatus Paceibacterota bacterium]